MILPGNRQDFKEIIMAEKDRNQRMKEITERLEQGVKDIFTSEMYANYLRTMSQFHSYSFNNTLLIHLQKPEASLVAGYQTWQKKFHRQVRRGEKGIQIIAPAPIRTREEIEKVDPATMEPVLKPDGTPEMEEVEYTIPRFRVTTVFGQRGNLCRNWRHRSCWAVWRIMKYLCRQSGIFLLCRSALMKLKVGQRDITAVWIRKL